MKNELASRISDLKTNQFVNSANQKEDYQLKDKNWIWYYPVFGFDKIEVLVDEFLGDIREFKQSRIEMDDRFFNEYLYFQIINHFTEYGEYITADLREKHQMFKNLLVVGHIHEIMEEVFSSKEVLKVWHKLSRDFAIEKNMIDFEGMMLKRYEELKISNEELMNDAFNNIDNHNRKQEESTNNENTEADKA